MATYANFFALLEVENLEKQFADELRKGTEVHTARHGRPPAPGIADGTVRDENVELLAYGVVSTVGLYGHFHRTGRIPIPVDELAAFVGRFVVCSLASHEKVARRVLAVPLADPPSPSLIVRSRSTTTSVIVPPPRVRGVVPIDRPRRTRVEVPE
jgi:hypothetical protein